MHRTSVTSSSIESIGYDRDASVLEVQFKGSGEVYQYPGTRPEEYAALMAAPSKGGYLHQYFVRTAREYNKRAEDSGGEV